MNQNPPKASQDISESLSGKRFKVNCISNNGSCGCKSGLSSEQDPESIFLVLSKLIHVLDPSPPTKANGINGKHNLNAVSNAEIPASEAINNISPAPKATNSSTDNDSHTKDSSCAANEFGAPEYQPNTDTWETDANAMEVEWPCESDIMQMDDPNKEVAAPNVISSDGIKEASNSETSADRDASDMNVAEVLDDSAESSSSADSDSNDESSNSTEDQTNESFRVNISSDGDGVSLYSGINDGDSGNEDLNDVDMDANIDRNEDHVAVESIGMESDCIDLEATSEAPKAEQKTKHVNKAHRVQPAVEADAAAKSITSRVVNREIIDLTLSSPPCSPLEASRPIQLQPSPKVKTLPQESQQESLSGNSRVSPQDGSDRSFKSEQASRQALNLQPPAPSNPIPNSLPTPFYSRPPFSAEARPHQTSKVLQDNSLKSANESYPGLPYQTQGFTSQNQSEYGDSNAQFRDLSFYSNNPDADPSKVSSNPLFYLFFSPLSPSKAQFLGLRQLSRIQTTMPMLQHLNNPKAPQVSP
ncbi:hypothetical protein DSO57_1015668 [Entomophthora muscae]|uniref:Uncharacterized protein n=1 Tax=Entomophthora muscae TaxID=34485 RepID=A0ACC2UQR1_9FUNG|nr:hypothetical protein DSO57_1015668 [Entomophthora muscae]